MDLGMAIAKGLERGRARGWLADLASHAWAKAARIERPLRWRDGARVVAVGGPTLGGSGKTPVAIACAEELRLSGARVALVGHAYGASPGRARHVEPGDNVREVGDEAIVCATRLAPIGVRVTVGRDRQAATDLALATADIAVIDGLCQTTPRRASLSLLVVDADEPWGAGQCPPKGDLRAPRGSLLASADRVVVVGAARWGFSPAPHPVDEVDVVSRGAWAFDAAGRQTLFDWAALRQLRLGLWTGLAHPERVLRVLSRHGIVLVEAVCGRDHQGPLTRTRGPRFRPLDLWLTTEKCHAQLVARMSPGRSLEWRTHMWTQGMAALASGGIPPAPASGSVSPGLVLDGVAVAILDHRVTLSSSLKEALSRLDPKEGRP
jgi:tetraacyldisaccharide 4'-kinase